MRFYFHKHSRDLIRAARLLILSYYNILQGYGIGWACLMNDVWCMMNVDEFIAEWM